MPDLTKYTHTEVCVLISLLEEVRSKADECEIDIRDLLEACLRYGIQTGMRNGLLDW